MMSSIFVVVERREKMWGAIRIPKRTKVFLKTYDKLEHGDRHGEQLECDENQYELDIRLKRKEKKNGMS